MSLYPRRFAGESLCEKKSVTKKGIYHSAFKNGLMPLKTYI